MAALHYIVETGRELWKVAMERIFSSFLYNLCSETGWRCPHPPFYIISWYQHFLELYKWDLCLLTSYSRVSAKGVVVWGSENKSSIFKKGREIWKHRHSLSLNDLSTIISYNTKSSDPLESDIPKLWHVKNNIFLGYLTALYLILSPVLLNSLYI